MYLLSKNEEIVLCKVDISHIVDPNQQREP